MTASIAIIGHSAWDYWRQPQVFAEQWSRTRKVVYVERLLSYDDLRWQGETWLGYVRRFGAQASRRINENLVVLEGPPGLPLTISGLSRIASLTISRWSLQVSRAMQARLLCRRFRRLRVPTQVLFLTHPFDLLLVGTMGEAVSCFYVYDEVAQFYPAGDPTRVLVEAIEREYLHKVDLVFASSRAQYERRRTLHPRVSFVPNGVDFDRFHVVLDDPGEEPAALRGAPRPRLVYSGAADGRLDFALLRELAASRREWSLVICGWAHRSCETAMADLAALPNVYWLRTAAPERAPPELPRILRWCDVGIIPFCVTPSTNTMLPLKLFEYFAVGLPVVATPLGEVQRLGGAVEIASDLTEFSEAVERSLAADSAARRAARTTMAREHAWTRRVAEMSAAIDERIASRLAMNRVQVHAPAGGR